VAPRILTIKGLDVNTSIIARGASAGQQQQSLFEQLPEAAPQPVERPHFFAPRTPIAAKTDPITSHLAASEITASGLRAGQKRELLEWLRGVREPLTSAEISAASGFDRHGVARRLPDLAADKLVERCLIRDCRQSGRPAVTWRAL
jgi:hypothetical protein